MRWRRLSEPSTWAGIAVLLGLFGIDLAPESLQSLAGGAAGLAGVAAVLTAEKGSGRP